MQGDGALDFLPVWGVFAATFLAILVSVEVGYRIGMHRRKHAAEEKETPVGTMVGAILGLVAFLLAFTFGLAGTRYDARRQLILDEANAIGTTYLRAAMLPEPHRTESRRLLREYVGARLEAATNGKEGMVTGLARSEVLQNQLWVHATAVGESSPNSIVIGLFIQSLNETIDLHAKRLNMSVRNRIPGTIWFALYSISILALGAMGYHSGLSGTSRSLAILAVAFSFSLVVWLIADLDRPREGMLQVSQQAMIDVKNSMAEPSPP